MNKKEIRIVYLGTPYISSIVLSKLLENNYNIVGVISQPDKPIGRKMIIEETPVKKVALAHNLPVFQPNKLNFEYDFLKNLKPDIILTMAYGQIISEDVLRIAKILPLNLHGSLLPKYRGASPIQASLFNGEKESGCTLMEMINKMDAGRMFYKSKFEITEDDNYDSLIIKTAEAAFKAFDEGIQDVIDQKNLGEIQNENEATFTKKIKSEDQIINFDNDAKAIVHQIQALSSTPGAYFVYKNTKFKVLKARYSASEAEKSGKILEFNKNSFLISAKNGAVSILEIQKEGKKVMPIKDFYNGNVNNFKVNDTIND